MANHTLAYRLQPAVHVPTFARVGHRAAREKGALARQLCRRVPEAAAYAYAYASMCSGPRRVLVEHNVAPDPRHTASRSDSRLTLRRSFFTMKDSSQRSPPVGTQSPG